MSATFKAPRQYLSPRRYDPNKPKRKISEEHKQKILSALEASRKNK